MIHSLLHFLERAAGGIDLHVNANKTEYMCVDQRGDISTLKGGPLKRADNFTCLGSSVSSTKNDMNTRLAKALTAIYRLSVILKSDLTDIIKQLFFFSSRGRVDTSIWMHDMDTKRMEKKIDGNCTRMLRAILNKSWRQHSTKQQLYGYQQPITKTIHAGHCCCKSKDKIISDMNE